MRSDLFPSERTILVAEDEDTDDEQHIELQQVQSVQEKRS